MEAARRCQSSRSTHEQAAALLARDPAARVSLDHPGAVARLLDELRRAGCGMPACGVD